MSVAVAILRLRLATMPRPPTSSPRSRSAGEGQGVRAALTFPPCPPSSPTLRERKGGRTALPWQPRTQWLRGHGTLLHEEEG
jgi:hypothetical protein